MSRQSKKIEALGGFSEKCKSLEASLKSTFKDKAYLELALTHSSLSHEQGTKVPHNERLEFLGDAVLELAVTQHLYKKFPKVPEGRLTKLRSHLVNRSALAEIAGKLQLGNFLKIGKSEEINGGRKRPSNLANAFEAIVGAIFLDRGYEEARRFVIRQIVPQLKKIKDHPEPSNTKGMLQEKLHTLGKHAIYKIISEEGPAHQREFHAVVELDGEIIGEGKGSTKKEAESKAAKMALTTFDFKV